MPSAFSRPMPDEEATPIPGYLVIHADGTVDMMRVTPDQYLQFAQLAANLASELVGKVASLVNEIEAELEKEKTEKPADKPASPPTKSRSMTRKK